MHLYVISLPEMDQVWHLHPDRVEAGVFAKDLPPCRPDDTRCTATSSTPTGCRKRWWPKWICRRSPARRSLGDDAAGAGPPDSQADPNRTVAQLPDGSRMVWERDAGPLHAKRAMFFRFRLEDADGTARAEHGTLHGHAGARRVCALGPQCVRACASLRIGAHGFAQPDRRTPAMVARPWPPWIIRRGWPAWSISR